MERHGSVRRLAWLAIAVAVVGCDFQPDPPEGPSALPPGRFVTVTVQYRQPAGCQNSEGTCDARVVFFGSWMRPKDGGYEGDQVLLDTPFGPNFWTGVVENVPVNWPPNDEPHYVRVYDPHLRDTSTGGVTAARLIVGGQSIYYFDAPSTPQESGLIYIDDNSVGHNPF